MVLIKKILSLLSSPGFGKLDLTLRMYRALSKMAAITQTSRTGIWHLFTFLRYLDDASHRCQCDDDHVIRRPHFPAYATALRIALQVH